MERKKYILIILIFFTTMLHASSNLREDIYEAYIQGDMMEWKSIIDKMEQQNPKTDALVLELINYQYGFVGWCLGVKQKDLAATYCDAAKKNIELLEGRGYRLSDINAYKSAFYGYSIGMNILSAPFIGPKSLACARKAVEIDKKNPLGYIQLGNAEFFMPSVFGGSKETALWYYKKAEALFEIQTSGLQYNWQYLSLLISIAQTFIDLGKLEQAKNYYEKLLDIEPDFQWVKNELYPDLLKMLEQTDN